MVDPSNIPNHIDVDVNDLAIGHSLHVSDIKVPEGVEVLDDQDATVCAAAIPKAAVEAVPVVAAAWKAQRQRAGSCIRKARRRRRAPRQRSRRSTSRSAGRSVKVIVGLGNPGREYDGTRHNVGWWVVDHLADVWRFEGWKKDPEALRGRRNGPRRESAAGRSHRRS